MSPHKPELCGFNCPGRLAPDMDPETRDGLMLEAARRLEAKVITTRCSGWCNSQLPDVPETHIILTTAGSRVVLGYNPEDTTDKPFKLFHNET